MLTLFEVFGAVFLFIGGRTALLHLFLALQPWASSNYRCIVLFLASVRYSQNRHRKVFQIGRLYVCAAWLDILKYYKKSTDLYL